MCAEVKASADLDATQVRQRANELESRVSATRNDALAHPLIHPKSPDEKLRDPHAGGVAH